MKSLLLTLFLLCGVQVYAQYGGRNFYKEYLELSLPKHPMLVHLKGNIKKISYLEDSRGTQRGNEFYKKAYHFENNKLISTENDRYFYDKDGYLKKIISDHTSIIFVSDSISHKLIQFGFENSGLLFSATQKENKVFLNDDTEPSFILNEENKIVSINIGFNKQEFFYDITGNLTYYYDNSYYIGMGDTCRGIFDKYCNLVYYFCSYTEHKQININDIPYSYSNLDKKGNWQLGQSMSQSNKEEKTPLITKRTYEYYPD